MASSEGGLESATTVADMTHLVDRVLRGRPWLSSIWSTDYGRVGIVLIPVVDLALFEDRARAVEAAVAGVEMAADLGARCISFTGMIPAATSYGRAIAEAVKGRAGQDRSLTTGHAAVVAAFVFNIERLLAATHRSYQDERVGFVGLGSIGLGTLELLFRLGQRPRSVTLVDVAAKAPVLAALRARIRSEFGFAGPVEVVVATAADQGGIPQPFYEQCSLVVGATSSANIIDIDRLPAGALLVDDSFPHSFDCRKAKRRIANRRDILVTVAGALSGPGRFEIDGWYDTGDASLDAVLASLKGAAHPAPQTLTGCVLSALLTPQFNLPPTLGPVTADDSSAYYAVLRAHGFHGALPHVLDLSSGGSFTVDPEALAAAVFRAVV